VYNLFSAVAQALQLEDAVNRNEHPTKKIKMKTKNTYSMLVEAEEKGRSIFESTIYGLVVLCVAFTGWQFASNAVVTPGMNRGNGTSVEMATQSPAPAPVVLASR
jgi:hypothetical protein